MITLITFACLIGLGSSAPLVRFMQHVVFAPRTQAFNYEAYNIPPIIFRTWNSDAVTPTLLARIRNTASKSPTTETVLLHGASRLNFIKQHCPFMTKSYESLIPGAFKADVLRLCALYAFGGFYADMGVEITVDLYSLIKADTELLLTTDLDFGYWNGFIAASPRHPFLHACLRQIKIHVETCFYGKRDLEITGPHLLGNVYKQMYPHPQQPKGITFLRVKRPPHDWIVLDIIYKGVKVGTSKHKQQKVEYAKYMGYNVTYVEHWKRKTVYTNC